MKAPLSLKIAGGVLALLGLALLGLIMVLYLFYLEGGLWGMTPQLKDLILGFISSIVMIAVGVGIIFSKKIAVYAAIPLGIYAIVMFILEGIHYRDAYAYYVWPADIAILVYLLALIYLSVSCIIKSRRQKQNNQPL